MNEKCTKCKQHDCVEDDFLCASCISEYAGQIAAHHSKVADDELNRLTSEADAKWERFCASNRSFEAYENFHEIHKNLKSRKQLFDKFNDFYKSYKTSNNNYGKGVMFLGDFGNEARDLAFYMTWKLLRKYVIKGIFFTFDYATVGTCLANVFMDPSENYYAGSDILILDSVDFVAMSEISKHGFNALASFVKYRSDNYKATLMVVNNSISKLPNNLEACLKSAFPTRLTV